MFDVGDSLRSALDGSAHDLAAAQGAVAHATASGTSRSGGMALAQAARSALFSEALLSAEHARLAEIKEAAK